MNPAQQTTDTDTDTDNTHIDIGVATGTGAGAGTGTAAAEPRAAVRPSVLRMPSPIGLIELMASPDEELFSLAIEHDGCLPHDTLPDRPTPLLRAAARDLRKYFSGAGHLLPVPPIDALAGTAFQRAVWHRLTMVPWGETITYGQIARDIGAPGAGRGIGNAVAANPIPLFVPCHRVLDALGRVTGYTQGAGVATKRWLLDHEGIDYRMRDEVSQPRLLATTSSTTSSSSPAEP